MKMNHQLTIVSCSISLAASLVCIWCVTHHRSDGTPDALAQDAAPEEPAPTEMPVDKEQAAEQPTLTEGPSVTNFSARPAAKTPGEGSAVAATVPADQEDESTDESELSPVDARVKERIESALEAEDLKAVIACQSEALAARSPEVRQAMVDALGWFGAEALPQLTVFIGDADEDVAESARNNWEEAVSTIEKEPVKASVVELAMITVRDEDFLESVSGEYIGMDEKVAVESLLRVIEGQATPLGIEKAKETYEFVTGEEFVSREEAERWLREEYEPPEAD